MPRTITIRDLDEASAAWIAHEAKRRGVEEQAVLKDLIRQSIGHERGLPVYRDLDDLAGTWTAEEAAEFRKATEHFSRVDQDLWR
ncbi:MAG: hypothetical protein QOH06_972 [Acidobacteriota bacterium]|jgi:hypothetical protein|nr:hypothetical protein [Acidobacteriota bacterium]